MNCTKNWRKGFTDHEHMVETLITNYNKVVSPRDIVWFLGDICFDNEACAIISKLHGDKRLVLGNHDTDRKCDIEQLVLAFDQVHGLVTYKDVWLSHAPIHPAELRGRFNVHGHMHEAIVNDPRYFNVCVEHTEYAPMLYTEIIERLKSGKTSNISSTAIEGGV